MTWLCPGTEDEGVSDRLRPCATTSKRTDLLELDLIDPDGEGSGGTRHIASYPNAPTFGERGCVEGKRMGSAVRSGDEASSEGIQYF